MTNSQPHLEKPSQKQIRYLKRLAEMTGGTFTYPATSKAASAEIGRLKKSRPTSLADRRRETKQVREDMATRRGDAASVRSEELGGYGSTAHWAGAPEEGGER